MKIYTSYFANIKNLEKEDIIPISIARYSPKWFLGKRYTYAAPTSFMLSSQCSREQYLSMYKDILRKLNPEYLVNAIRYMSRGKDVALCCYEKPEEFCHRHLLAEWLTQNGYEVKEFKVKEEPSIQMELDLFN